MMASIYQSSTAPSSVISAVESSSAAVGDYSSIDQDQKLEFSEDEETLIVRMYNLVGNRWALIAGRIPGRTAEEIEKYWNSRS